MGGAPLYVQWCRSALATLFGGFKNATFPNGLKPEYCMKFFHIVLFTYTLQHFKVHLRLKNCNALCLNWFLKIW